MAQNIKDIRYYKERFEIDGNRFNADELREYCERQCSNGSKPEQYRVFFIGMILPEEQERIAEWKRANLDALTSK